MNRARVFKSGNSQAIRLPKKFRFKGKEVAVFFLGQSIVLQPINETWKDVYNSIEGLSDADFNSMISIEKLPPQERKKL
jgi:antitoxin VapB